MTMKKKADKNVNNAYKELSGNPFKNIIKSIKLKLNQQYTKKNRRKNKNSSRV